MSTGYRRTLTIAALNFAALVGVSHAARTQDLQISTATTSRWETAPWPFTRDAWPQGLAVRCTGAECGAGVEVYLRPKLGFCNCATGVSDDFEVDNVSDLDLMSDQFAPVEAGAPVTFGHFTGRARAYQFPRANQSPRAAFAVALASGCDLIVAGASGESRTEVETAVRAFLSSPRTQRWIETSLGLR